MSIGWKAMYWKTGDQPGEKLVCPECKLPSKFTHRTRMYFFQVLGIPLFPVSGKRRLYKCGYCTSQFDSANVDLNASLRQGTLVTNQAAVTDEK